MAAPVAQYLFTVEEYTHMGEAGIFSPDARVELIEGTIIAMTPIGRRHAACVARFTDLFTDALRRQATVWVQNPVRLSDYSEPQPDVTLLKPRAAFSAPGHPGPADVLLLVEVSDTTLEYDRRVKLPLYARVEIREVWVVDLAGEVIEMYSAPANGTYTMSRLARRGEAVTSDSLPGLRLAVDAILG